MWILLLLCSSPILKLPVCSSFLLFRSQTDPGAGTSMLVTCCQRTGLFLALLLDREHFCGLLAQSSFRLAAELSHWLFGRLSVCHACAGASSFSSKNCLSSGWMLLLGAVCLWLLEKLCVWDCEAFRAALEMVWRVLLVVLDDLPWMVVSKGSGQGQQRS